MTAFKPSATALCVQRLHAVAALTIKAAFRFKLIPWLLLILITSVFSIPYLVTHNGSAEMFAQVQLTYSLMAASILIGASTIWLACGVMSQDFQRNHIVLLASKPLARWEIWVGKWLGISFLNANLLVITGICIYGLLAFHARDLSPEEQKRLQASTLTSRASVKEAAPDVELEVEQLYARRIQDPDIAEMDPAYVRGMLREEVQWMNQLVKPMHRRIWNLNAGSQAKGAPNALIQMRVKFYASWIEDTKDQPTLWVVGDPNSPSKWEKELNLSPMVTHEWSVPASLIDDNGNLHVECHNYTESSLVFKVEDGLEVLIKDGNFTLNYFKCLLVLFAWMTLLSALGLWATTFTSLPVATFLILTIILIASSDQLFKSIVSEGTISTVEENGEASWAYLDWILVPIFTVLHYFTESLRSISPIESLITGRNIQTIAMLKHLGILCGVLSGLLAGWGIYIFEKKEIAK
ncbi:hypothetical protein OAH76_03520 [Verrucomicrobia bacterium]|nr:hypothetical protein [Verrucomicrobiota bacterium]